MKKTVSLLLVLCAVLLYVACNKKENTVTPSESRSEEVSKTGDPYLDSLPVRDYGQQKFSILCTTQTAGFYDVTEAGGDTVSASVFARNSAVNERYSVDIRHKQLDGNSSGQKAFTAEIQQSVQLDSGYDLIVGQNYYCLPLATEGSLRDLASSAFIHWDEAWYSQKINDNAAINGKIYGASGTYIMSQISYALATLYNKELWTAEQHDEDLYQLVRDKQWTFEKLNEFVAGHFTDANNNEVVDADDRFGYVYNTHGVAASMAASNLPITSKDADGKLTIHNYYNTHLTDVFDSYYAFYNDSLDAYKTKEDFGPAIMLGKGNTLFGCAQLGALNDCAELKNSEYHIGVLPMPMYDETQSDYITYTMRWELFYIPVNADFERAAIVLEYLNYTSEQIVIPAYWKKALNDRAADAPQDSEMMYVVKDALWYDFVTFHHYKVPMRDAAASLINNRNKRIAQWWGSNEGPMQKLLDDLLADYGVIQ